MGLRSTKKYDNGYVVAMFDLSNDFEANNYRSRLALDVPTCPHCGEKLNPNREDLLIRVDNPLSKFLGFNAGILETKCQACHKDISVPQSTVILDDAFPSIVDILKKTRAQAAMVKSGGVRPVQPVAKQPQQHQPQAGVIRRTSAASTRRGGTANGRKG